MPKAAATASSAPATKRLRRNSPTPPPPPSPPIQDEDEAPEDPPASPPVPTGISVAITETREDRSHLFTCAIGQINRWWNNTANKVDVVIAERQLIFSDGTPIWIRARISRVSFGTIMSGGFMIFDLDLKADCCEAVFVEPSIEVWHDRQKCTSRGPTILRLCREEYIKFQDRVRPCMFAALEEDIRDDDQLVVKCKINCKPNELYTKIRFEDSSPVASEKHLAGLFERVQTPPPPETSTTNPKPTPFAPNFKLLVGSTVYYVNKTILSIMSPYFKKMLQADFKEKIDGEWKAPKEVDEETFHELLRYIYTREVAGEEKLTVELLVLAEWYELKQLKLRCEHYLASQLTVDTVLQTLVTADMHNAACLKRQCLAYVQINQEAVLASDHWNALCASQNAALADLIRERLGGGGAAGADQRSTDTPTSGTETKNQVWLTPRTGFCREGWYPCVSSLHISCTNKCPKYQKDRKKSGEVVMSEDGGSGAGSGPSPAASSIECDYIIEECRLRDPDDKAPVHTYRCPFHQKE